MFDTGDVGVFLGLDVGKTAHHGHGLTPAGKKVFDKQLPNSDPKLRAVLDKLTEKFGTVLVVVDQDASIGALPLTVARDAGCRVAYLPELAMRRIADSERYRCCARPPTRPYWAASTTVRSGWANPGATRGWSPPVPGPTTWPSSNASGPCPRISAA